ncbi:MAG: serine hydrolase domain-containing protein, partial [Candidatus Thorarchaeota archaeon]
MKLNIKLKLIISCTLILIFALISPSLLIQTIKTDNNRLIENDPYYVCENNEIKNLEPQADNYNTTQWKSFFDNEITNVMSVLNIPGMSLSIVNSTHLIYKKGYGYSSIEESKLVDPDTTIFRIGSVSKLFTWTAVMQVYEQGLIDFDEDVNTYLTAFKIKEKFNQPITMKHLITHSAGFEADWIWNGDATEETLLSLE